MITSAIICRALFYFLAGVTLGAIGYSIYDAIKNRPSRKKLKYDVMDYGNAELTLQRYRDRAIEIYTILDSGRRLMRGGYIGEVDFVPFIFKKGEQPELMTVITFYDADDESNDKESRQAWFPFELMNSNYINSLKLDDKIDIKWEKKSLPYGGGSIWKMTARFAEPVNERFLNNIRG